MFNKFECNCVYCQNEGFIWKIGPKKLWVELPKNGSSVLKSTILRTRHLVPEAEIKNSVSECSEGLLVLREPIVRFKSLLSHYFVDGNRLHFGTDWIRKHAGNSSYDNTTISQIVIKHWDSLGNIGHPHHWRTQYSFIPEGFLDLNLEVYNLNSLTDTFNIPKTNSTSSSTIELTDSCIEFIKEYYKEDFTLYEKYFTK